MKRIFIIVICIVSVAACKSAKKATVQTKPKKDHSIAVGNTTPERAHKNNNTITVPATPENKKEEVTVVSSNPTINSVIESAMGYLGTRYKYGGTSPKGMDCSGLVFTSFQNNNITVGRSSYEMSEQGSAVKLKNVEVGDLLFFITGRGKRINHVGLVIAVSNSDVKFIHSTTSRGVIISSINEGYWSSTFKWARRPDL